jgi:predicted kinase
MNSTTDFSPHPLMQLLERVQNFSDGPPVVILDLDSTLMENSGRTLKIFAEYAQDRPEYLNIARKIHPLELQWGAVGNLIDGGIPEQYIEGFRRFWAERFFTDHYVRYDRPMPGAHHFVTKLLEAGARICYLTGRDFPNMEQGTRDNLRTYGFPLDETNAVLIMKPNAEMDDTAFKDQAIERVKAMGTVVGAIDNHPGLANLFARAFPEAVVIHFDTIYPPEAPELETGVFQVKGFLLPDKSAGPYLVVMSGLPATGKSTAGRLISVGLDGEHLATDHLRKALFPSEQFSREERYTPEARKSVYVEMYRQAGASLSSGTSVVLDGTFLKARYYRTDLHDLARENDSKLVFVKTTCSDEVIRERMAQRRKKSDHFSEANTGTYDRMKMLLSEQANGYLDLEEDPLVVEGKAPLLIFDTGTEQFETAGVNPDRFLLEVLAVSFPLYRLESCLHQE